jgi:putative pyruvate formate lyase activating enzyme
MQDAIIEMRRQVGDLVVHDGVAERGLIIRHLVLPGDLAGSGLVMKFIGERVSKEAYVNIMDQYRPCGRITGDIGNPYLELLMRGITEKEYRYATGCARRYGLRWGFE